MRRAVPPWLRRGVGLVLLLLALEYLVLPQLAGARKSLDVLGGVHPAYLAVAVLLEAAALVAYAALTRAVLPREHRSSLWTLLRIDLTSLGVSHVVPGGAAAAGALRLRLLTGVGVPGREAVFAAAVQGVGSAVVLNVLLWLALVVSIPLRGGNALYGVAAALAVGLLTLASAVVVGVTRGQERSVRIVRAAARRLPLVTPEAGEAAVRGIGEQLRTLGSHRRLLVAATFWGAANWLLDAASLWVFVAAYGYRVGPDGLLVAFCLANVLAVLPVTPGGLGIVEGVLVPTLVGFGSPRGVAILGVVSYRLVNFWLPIPVSALTYVSLRTGPLRRRPPVLASALAHPPPSDPRSRPEDRAARRPTRP